MASTPPGTVVSHSAPAVTPCDAAAVVAGGRPPGREHCYPDGYAATELELEDAIARLQAYIAGEPRPLARSNLDLRGAKPWRDRGTLSP